MTEFERSISEIVSECTPHAHTRRRPRWRVHLVSHLTAATLPGPTTRRATFEVAVQVPASEWPFFFAAQFGIQMNQLNAYLLSFLLVSNQRIKYYFTPLSARERESEPRRDSADVHYEYLQRHLPFFSCSGVGCTKVRIKVRIECAVIGGLLVDSTTFAKVCLIGLTIFLPLTQIDPPWTVRTGQWRR